jgi:hypothetical protein
MLTAVGPVLGDGRALGYRDRDGTTTWYGYRNGAVSLVGQPASPTVSHPARLPRPRPPVAVLTSRLTASAGEGVAMAFAGRPAARSFGEPTAGVPTGNAQLRLPDGAELHLTMGIGVDRLESRPANDHPTAVDNTPPLSARRDMFLDERGTALRVTWHPERDLVVLSVWQHDRCVGTFRMPVQDVPRLSGLLAAALGDWVDQADGTGGGWRPPEGGSGGDLSVQQRLRLSRPVLRLRGLQHRRRRPPPVAPS